MPAELLMWSKDDVRMVRYVARLTRSKLPSGTEPWVVTIYMADGTSDSRAFRLERPRDAFWETCKGQLAGRDVNDPSSAGAKVAARG